MKSFYKRIISAFLAVVFAVIFVPETRAEEIENYIDLFEFFSK